MPHLHRPTLAIAALLAAGLLTGCDATPPATPPSLSAAARETGLGAPAGELPPRSQAWPATLPATQPFAGGDADAWRPGRRAAPSRGPAVAPAPLRSEAELVRLGHLQLVPGYRAASQLALSEGKPMMLFFTARWCHYCKEMAATAFVDPQVASLSRHFVCVLVDADREPQVCRQFRVQAFPTVQFLSATGVPLNRLVGSKSGVEVTRQMQAALQAVARRATAPSDVRR